MRNQTTKKAPFNRGDEDLMMAMRSIWLGMRDSNPRSWDQNPVPYHLANPQYWGDYIGVWLFWIAVLQSIH